MYNNDMNYVMNYIMIIYRIYIRKAIIISCKSNDEKHFFHYEIFIIRNTLFPQNKN